MMEKGEMEEWFERSELKDHLDTFSVNEFDDLKSVSEVCINCL